MDEARQTRPPRNAQPDAVPLGPESLTWQHFGTHRFGLVLPQAFILQAAHPVINAAITAEKKYLHDPWGRARGSIELLWPVVYARPDVATEMGRRLRELHRSIKGVDRHGHRYHALDPEAYGWVHMTGFYSTLKMHEVFGPALKPGQRAQVFAEWRQMAGMLGIAERFLPDNEAQYWVQFNRMIEENLDQDNEALKDLLDPDHFSQWPVHPALEGKLPRWLWQALMFLPSRLLNLIIRATLPENARERLGLRYGRLDRLLFGAFAGTVRRLEPLLPERLRYIGLARHAIEDARRHPEAYPLMATADAAA